jgi:hypothetical protein
MARPNMAKTRSRLRANPLSGYVCMIAREYYRLLKPDGLERSGDRDVRWKLIVNETVEPDL